MRPRGGGIPWADWVPRMRSSAGGSAGSDNCSSSSAGASVSSSLDSSNSEEDTESVISNARNEGWGDGPPGDEDSTIR